jgi:hypothetical protein
LNGVVRGVAGDTDGDGYGDLFIRRQEYPAGSIHYARAFGGNPPATSDLADDNNYDGPTLVGDFDADGRSEAVIPTGWDLLRSVSIVGGSVGAWTDSSAFNRCAARDFSRTPAPFSVSDSNDDGFDDLTLSVSTYPGGDAIAQLTGSPSGLSPDHCALLR